jgi:hypothetical protein
LGLHRRCGDHLAASRSSASARRSSAAGTARCAPNPLDRIDVALIAHLHRLQRPLHLAPAVDVGALAHLLPHRHDRAAAG